MKLLPVILTLMVVGCGQPSYSVQYSTSRGVGDLSATFYLERSDTYIIQKELIASFSNGIVIYLLENRDNITDNAFLIDQIKQQIPSFKKSRIQFKCVASDNTSSSLLPSISSVQRV